MNKIPVAVLAATGAVGQRFVQLLADHPWFEIKALAASERSAGKTYAEACNWILSGEPPASLSQMTINPLAPDLPAQILFSALPASVARKYEPIFAQAGYAVCSNASAYRYEPDVPLVIPEVNADHMKLIKMQQLEHGWPGFIVTSPNCTTTGCVMPLKALDEAFKLERVFATSLQAASGAGYPGIPALDILDNIIPYIPGEEEKVEQETRLLLGQIADGAQVEAEIAISAQANRVPVMDGHTVCLSAGFQQPPTIEEAIHALTSFKGKEKTRGLPSAPEYPILVSPRPDRPQPRRDRDNDRGMVVTVGRVRPCPLLDLRMVSMVHNTLRGAASGSILNAELLVSEGYLP